MRVKNQAIWSVLAMVTIWLIILTSKINSIYYNAVDISNRVDILELINTDKEPPVFLQPKEIEEVEELKDTSIELSSFEATFKEVRNNYGPGVVFSWNGNDYTTNYYEEENTN